LVEIAQLDKVLNIGHSKNDALDLLAKWVSNSIF
jgi:hypothetical protein